MPPPRLLEHLLKFLFLSMPPIAALFHDTADSTNFFDANNHITYHIFILSAIQLYQKKANMIYKRCYAIWVSTASKRSSVPLQSSYFRNNTAADDTGSPAFVASASRCGLLYSLFNF